MDIIRKLCGVVRQKKSQFSPAAGAFVQCIRQQRGRTLFERTRAALIKTLADDGLQRLGGMTLAEAERVAVAVVIACASELPAIFGALNGWQIEGSPRLIKSHGRKRGRLGREHLLPPVWEPTLKRLADKALEIIQPGPEPAANAGVKPAKQKPKRGDTESLCIAALVKHPHWTNKQIAAHVGIHPATIAKSRMPNFFKARRAASGTIADLPRGAKAGDDGDVDATYREDGGVNSMPCDDD